MGLVDDQQRAVFAGEVAQPRMEARLRQHHADIGQRRLRQHAGDIALLQRRFQPRQIVELHDRGPEGQIIGLADQSPAGHRPAIPEAQEGIVDRAVIAAVEHQHLGPAGDGAAPADDEAVGVGGRGGHLPEGQAELARQELAHHRHILGRQHIGEAMAGLGGDRRRHGRGRMAEHRAGVAQAEIVIAVAVDVGQRGTGGIGDEEREGRTPIEHPMHGHAVMPMRRAALGELARSGIGLQETVPLAPDHGIDLRAPPRPPRPTPAGLRSSISVPSPDAHCRGILGGAPGLATSPSGSGACSRRSDR